MKLHLRQELIDMSAIQLINLRDEVKANMGRTRQSINELSKTMELTLMTQKLRDLGMQNMDLKGIDLELQRRSKQN